MYKSDASFIPVPFIEREIDIEERADGTLIVRNTVPLREIDRHLPALFRSRVERNPDRTWLAQRRGPDRLWQKVSYAEAKRLIDGATQALLNLDKAGRPVSVEFHRVEIPSSTLFFRWRRCRRGCLLRRSLLPIP